MYENQDIKKLQKQLLEIIIYIDDFCKDNKINYFIIAGTALGAYRHKGFIPWDDDLDIGMTRKNYNKFCELFDKKEHEEYFLQNFSSENDTPFYFSKIRKNNTRFIEKYCRRLDIHHGIYVDIFPFDNIPNTIKAEKRQKQIVSLWSNLFIAKSVTGSSVDQTSLVGRFKVALRFILHFLIKPIPKKYIYDKINFHSQKFNDVSCSKMSYIKYTFLKIDTKNIENTEKILFESKLLPCPSNLEKYLKHNYGDYMKLPIESERVGHSPYLLEL